MGPGPGGFGPKGKGKPVGMPGYGKGKGKQTTKIPFPADMSSTDVDFMTIFRVSSNLVFLVLGEASLYMHQMTQRCTQID